MKYFYGPVYSWRLGNSLGIDLISGEKNCTYDCIYCQVGKTKRFGIEREVFVPTSAVIEQFEKLPKIDIDYITFSGTGEPTLALNMGEVILELKKRTKAKIAVLTNSTLMWKSDVRKELSCADIVLAKLDAPNEVVFNVINKPVEGITFHKVVEGVKIFAKEYPSKLALQVMFVSENKSYANDIAKLSKEIGPIEVQINTPLRPSDSKPLKADELKTISNMFKPLKVLSVFDAETKEVKPLDNDATSMRRPRLQ